MKCVEGKEIDYVNTSKNMDNKSKCIKLYRVENYKELVKNKEFILTVYSWNNYFNTDRAKQLTDLEIQTNNIQRSLEFNEMDYI